MRLDVGAVIDVVVEAQLQSAAVWVYPRTAESPQYALPQGAVEAFDLAVPLGVLGLAVDEQRLAMEMAIQADRLDVQEELSRFASHITAFRQSLNDPSGEPVGKRLGFLLQEMLREANTTGSKANDARMLADVVTVKEELERVREQVENLE